MSNAAYDRLWRDAMKDLAELVAIEDPQLGATGAGEAKPLPVVVMPPHDAYEHYRSVYLRYLQVYQKLERCYEGMLHPQKRIDVNKVIESVIARLVQLRHAIVKWHPLNPEISKLSAGKPFAWEYIDFDDKLIDLKLQPEALEIPVPASFKEERRREHTDRDIVISSFMQRILGVDKTFAEIDDGHDLDIPGLSFTVEEAVAVIHRNERGRQAKVRAAVWKERRMEEAKATAAATSGLMGLLAGRGRRGMGAMVSAESDADGSSEDEMDPEEAVVQIQRLARGFLARKQVERAKAAELVFVGMKDAPRPRLAALEAAMAETAKLRKVDQVANKEAYDSALDGIAKIVLEEHGTEMRDKMRADRTTWFTGKLGVGIIPEDLSGYYSMLNAAATGEVKEEEEVDPKAKGKGKDAGKAKAPAKDDKKGKGKKGPVEEEAPDKPPPVTGATEWSKKVEVVIRAYDATWIGRDESNNASQRHDVELAREIVKPTVEETIRVDVDASMTENFKNFLALKKGAGDKKKDKKGAKKKKSTKDKKKKKGEKSLPGAKACASLELKDFLSLLIENRLINNPRPSATFSTFLGGINLLGSKYAKTDSPAQRHPAFGFWMPADPSMAQVREALMHYAVLPFGSDDVRSAVTKYCTEYKMCDSHAPRSVLLYGPRGCGKTHLAQAVANALGGLFINLSAGNVDGKFVEKGGAAKLLHMAFEVAKDAALGPCIIYIDEVEKMLAAGKKKASGSESGPTRFKKDLATYFKSLNDSHPAILIGCSSEPWEADIKAVNEVFEKKIYIPCLDYATRLKMWRTCIAASLAAVPDQASSTLTTSALSTMAGAGANRDLADPLLNAWGGVSNMTPSAAGALDPYISILPFASASATGVSYSTSSILEKLNLSSLAGTSNGYTAGSIRKAVRATLTPRRLERLAHRPLVESEFLSVLARCPRVYADESDKFREFTDAVTGLTDRRKPAEDDATKGKDKKGKKK